MGTEDYKSDIRKTLQSVEPSINLTDDQLFVIATVIDSWIKEEFGPNI